MCAKLMSAFFIAGLMILGLSMSPASPVPRVLIEVEPLEFKYILITEYINESNVTTPRPQFGVPQFSAGRPLSAAALKSQAG